MQPTPQPNSVTLRVASCSDPGLDPDKQVNEDSFIYSHLPIGHLLLVCDGMGGHSGGKQASELAVRTIVSDLEATAPTTSPTAPAMALKAAIEHAGQLVYALGGEGTNVLRPGSTTVAVLSHAGGSEIAHVGDSRGYLLRGGTIHAITRDHSMVQQLVDAGVLPAHEAIHHPDANKITRALGMKPTVKVEVRATPIAHQPGDIFLLCTDGLTDLVTPEELLATTLQGKQTRGLDFACHQLIALANSRGGHDNITVVLGEIVDCPACVEAQAKTIVDSSLDDHPPASSPPAPIDPLATLVGPQSGALAVQPAQPVQPTLIDDGPYDNAAATAGYAATNGPRLAPTLAGEPQSLAAGVAWTPPAATPSTVSGQLGVQSLSFSNVPVSGANVSTTEYHDAVQRTFRRQTTLIIVGIGLILIALMLIAASLWWAYSSPSDPGDEPAFEGTNTTRIKDRGGA